MASWEQQLSDVMTGEFVVLFVVAVWQWLRYRARGAGWAAASFGLLAAIAVTSIALRWAAVIPPAWLLKCVVAALLLVPYALYRFAASFVPLRARWRRAADLLTAGALVGTALIHYLPVAGQPAPPGYLSYRILITAQWGLLFGFVAVRMWRAGAHQPQVARYRMRFLAIAAAGLDVPVIIGTLAVTNEPWVQLASEINTLVMAGLFAVALVLPGAVRTWWRSGERNAMQVAVADLVRAYSAEDVASGLLPHVAALTGAADIAFIDSSGAEISRYRAALIPEQRQSPDDPATTRMVPIEVPIGRGHRLVVRSDPYLPFFARNEFRLLSHLGEFVGLAIDRCELLERDREAQARLAHQATHDALTGLPNRLLFADRLSEALARARRQSSAVAIMFLDLDQFKLINDGIDHAAGDEVLAEVARRLLAAARVSDTVARFGGDEFTVLADVGSEYEALGLADRFREAISAPIYVGQRDLALRVSIGVVVTQGDGDPVSLVRDADAAMYRAKESGRDRVVLFGAQIRKEARLRLDIERDLRHALFNGEIVAVYQPIVDLQRGGVIGVEALVRWDHPILGRLGPEEFLGVSEETGLILSLGERVLTLACREAARWVDAVGDHFRVWVNVSARQFADPDLCDGVMRILHESGLPPSALGIELTESVLLDPSDLTAEQLRRLRACGVSVAIDDFGTGFSSLSYLTRFPVDRLKIDRSFVDRLGTEPSISVINACLALGRSLGLTTVAEGVETPEQAAWLSQAGCDAAQGYHYARPLEPEDVTAMLAGSQLAASLPMRLPTSRSAEPDLSSADVSGSVAGGALT
ncbi:MAG TPA: EAL domain-containing protein [Mycobacteriales bacterium]|nr:EAL domain-containing protein [Mycobacteriales bacterium]